MAVNGVAVAEAGTLADPHADVITVDGRPLPRAEPAHYVLLNKPRGYVTTLRDPRGRPVVTDLVRVPARVYPVGRLDADVEGALLLTNDGPLTHRLLHPRYGVERTYEAAVRGQVSERELARWRRGVTLEDGPARPREVTLLGPSPEGSRLRLVFTEGRKHEVKRFCEAFGHPVARLRRVAFGPVALGSLPVGRARALRRDEVRALRAAVRGASGSP